MEKRKQNVTRRTLCVFRLFRIFQQFALIVSAFEIRIFFPMFGDRFRPRS